MTYQVGQRMLWTPMHWRWDVAREVIVERLYPRGRALLSNGVQVDEDGYAMVYGPGQEVGRVTVMK